MPVVDTVQTFNTGDTVTSTSLNNIMDQSVFVSGAVVANDGLVVSAGGQMTIENLKVTGAKIADGEISTSKIADSNVTTAKIADANVTTAKIADANVTQAKLASNVAGNGPAFSAYPSSNQSVAASTDVKVLTQTVDFDTNSNFSSSRFTPSVAGYYSVSAVVWMTTTDALDLSVTIRKNNANLIVGPRMNGQSYSSGAYGMVYMNGSTDYLELFVRHLSASSRTILAAQTQFQGCLIRSA